MRNAECGGGVKKSETSKRGYPRLPAFTRGCLSIFDLRPSEDGVAAGPVVREKKVWLHKPHDIVAQPFMFAHANCGLRFCHP